LNWLNRIRAALNWHRHRGETFLECATRISLKHKMPTRAIRQQVHDLTTQLQIMLSHVEQLPSDGSKAQQEHIREIRLAVKAAVKIIGTIQNLAAIELNES
jgi:hypothetical protein